MSLYRKGQAHFRLTYQTAARSACALTGAALQRIRSGIFQMCAKMLTSMLI